PDSIKNTHAAQQEKNKTKQNKKTKQLKPQIHLLCFYNKSSDYKEYIYSIIDIAYNPDVLQRAEENPEKMQHLIHLTLRFVEERCKLVLSYLYTVESFKLKGSLEKMQQRLTGQQMPTPLICVKNLFFLKELTLDQLLHTLEAEDCSNAPVLLKEESVTQSKAHLIEEITSTEIAEKPSAPVYEMITVKDANKNPLKIELRIELPKVSSVSECDLRISKDDVIIEVPEKYKLQLDLPEVVDEETATAVFNKGKRVLFITVLVAKRSLKPAFSPGHDHS
uniref:PIH1 domain-containing protein 2 n=1 Tax=Athene cunicularia TaxID=194338 RepID=A0A663LZH8_ATHCN